MINKTPNTNLNLGDLTDAHLKSAFEIYQLVVGGNQDYSYTGMTIDYVKEELARHFFVDFRFGSRLSMQSKFVVELKQSRNDRYINFSYDSNIYPEPKEAVALGLKFDEQVRKSFLK